MILFKEEYENKKTYGILAILLGGVGVHFSMPVRTDMAFYQFFLLTFVPSIIGIVIGIMALCSRKKFQKKFILQE